MATRPLTSVRALVATVALAGLLAGCGVRLETEAPAPLTPDATESARQRGSADALSLEVLASDPAADPANPATAVRATVAAHAGEHLLALGGVYADSAASPSPSSTATTDPAPGEVAAASTDAVVTQLTQSAANARADAETVPDGALARLLASIAAERLLLARQLAGAATPAVPELPGLVAPDQAPAGVPASALSALVAAEDEAAYGYEVIAAKQSETMRANALARAAVHRSRAQDWAVAAGISRTGLDPRRTAYALPAGLEDPATAATLAQTMEQSLAATYAALVASADPDARTPLIDALAEATNEAATWGAPTPPFPGL
ncbi:DUF4439 domain-containing protein [Pengzhenrongella sicca]|uniref:DUF4439 domain-containing protein n=1 Tax=Pengzhenrongella sicca TaxID=2819238 RepID=A0A8A4ZHY2_9MICO|nr:DUF4439 domain-containing protein [Pengzhenrongella sicca]QTE30583.1 DUF4439 domain-containing protein [Pengzhenrongella sicca]